MRRDHEIFITKFQLGEGGIFKPSYPAPGPLRSFQVEILALLHREKRMATSGRIALIDDLEKTRRMGSHGGLGGKGVAERNGPVRKPSDLVSGKKAGDDCHKNGAGLLAADSSHYDSANFFLRLC